MWGGTFAGLNAYGLLSYSVRQYGDPGRREGGRHIVNGRAPDTRKKKNPRRRRGFRFSAIAVSPRLIQKDHVVQIVG